MITFKRLVPAMALAGALAVFAAACGNSGASTGFDGTPLTGAGSTFAAPMYQRWAQSFRGKESGAKVNYQSIGSGGGVTQFTAQTVDFGASDVPLQTDEVSALKVKNYIEFPTCLGAVVIAYHVTGIQNGLKLDGPTVADIFFRFSELRGQPAQHPDPGGAPGG